MELEELKEEIKKVYDDAMIYVGGAFIFARKKNEFMFESYSVDKKGCEYHLNLCLGTYVYPFFKDENPQRILDVIKEIKGK